MKTPTDCWERRTFHLELIRSIPAGMIETATTTFAVYVAVSTFQAGAMHKGLLVASASIGLFLSMFWVQWIRRTGCSLNTGASAVWVLSALGFFFASASRDCLPIYLVGMIVGKVAVVMAAPLFSHIYREHYPAEKLGQLFAVAGLVRKLAAIGTGLLFGWILERNGENFPLLLICYGSGCLVMAGCTNAMKGVYLAKVSKVEFFAAFRHVKHDILFRKLLIAWMILGFGNVLCVSLFVEYAANPIHGFELGAAQVSWLTAITPEVTYLLTVFLWGRLFDRLNFFLVRSVINVFFVAGILTFFFGTSVWLLYVGLGLHGIGKAGGNVAWSLWVTKFADSENVAEYMSVHTFLTGCRGTIAPLLAFQMASFSPRFVSIVGSLLIILATFLIYSLKPLGDKEDRG